MPVNKKFMLRVLMYCVLYLYLPAYVLSFCIHSSLVIHGRHVPWLPQIVRYHEYRHWPMKTYSFNELP